MTAAEEQATLRFVPGEPVLDMGRFDLAGFGYRKTEWFLSATASGYHVEDRTENGLWNARPATTAPFTTRILVCSPDDADASGVIIVDWLNVSGGADSCAEWRYLHRHILRTGAVYVGVSA